MTIEERLQKLEQELASVRQIVNAPKFTGNAEFSQNFLRLPHDFQIGLANHYD